jgi:hypothetical protein
VGVGLKKGVVGGGWMSVIQVLDEVDVSSKRIARIKQCYGLSDAFHYLAQGLCA